MHNYCKSRYVFTSLYSSVLALRSCCLRSVFFAILSPAVTLAVLSSASPMCSSQSYIFTSYPISQPALVCMGFLVVSHRGELSRRGASFQFRAQSSFAATCEPRNHRRNLPANPGDRTQCCLKMMSGCDLQLSHMSRTSLISDSLEIRLIVLSLPQRLVFDKYSALSQRQRYKCRVPACSQVCAPPGAHALACTNVSHCVCSGFAHEHMHAYILLLLL